MKQHQKDNTDYLPAKHVEVVDPRITAARDPRHYAFKVDIDALNEKAKKLADNAGKGEWRSAHLKLLSHIREEYQLVANNILSRLRSQQGKVLNGWSYDRSQRPGQVTIDAKNALLALQNRTNAWLVEREIGTQEGEAQSEATHFETSGLHTALDTKTGRDWAQFVILLLTMIAVEAVFSIVLLMQADPGSVVGAFTKAFLASVVNVGALGAGCGMLGYLVHNNPSTKRWTVLGGSIWGVAVLGLNWMLGRQRQAYSLVADSRDPGTGEFTKNLPEAMNETSMFPVDWGFEALLFMLLGVALCAFAFAKGYTFMRPSKSDHVASKTDPESNETESTDQAKSTETPLSEREAILAEYEGLSEKYRRILTDEIRGQVAGWVEKLNDEYAQAHNALEDLEDDWEVGLVAKAVIGTFILEHNATRVDIISHADLEQNKRENKVTMPFPVTPADRAVLADVRGHLDRWRLEGQETFFADITKETQRIDVLWEKYDKVICKPLIVGAEKNSSGSEADIES